ncbi:MAG: hypothetical protein JWP22_1976 [Ramlibacter sp.]|nr:hypothetical protein [Ramlibacter sp.]
MTSEVMDPLRRGAAPRLGLGSGGSPGILYAGSPWATSAAASIQERFP